MVKPAVDSLLNGYFAKLPSQYSLSYPLISATCSFGQGSSFLHREVGNAKINLSVENKRLCVPP